MEMTFDATLSAMLGGSRVIGAAAARDLAVRAVDDTDLGSNGRFSLRISDPTCLGTLNLAVVEIQGLLAAFPIFGRPGPEGDISIDQMPLREDPPSATMDFLFANVIL